MDLQKKEKRFLREGLKIKVPGSQSFNVTLFCIHISNTATQYSALQKKFPPHHL